VIGRSPKSKRAAKKKDFCSNKRSENGKKTAYFGENVDFLT
jgi:hypothetical protein